MLGLKYIAFAVALVTLGALLQGKGDALVSAKMIDVLSAVQIVCKEHRETVGGAQGGCSSFADVRKIQMRDDNRSRSYAGGQIVQIGR